MVFSVKVKQRKQRKDPCGEGKCKVKGLLTFIPYYLRCYADVIFQLCGALGYEGIEFE